MLASIIDAVKGELVSSLSQRTGLDAGQAEQTVPLARESVTEGVTEAAAGGNLGGILDMLRGATGGTSSGSLVENTVYRSIAGKLIGKLTERLNLPASVADKVASVALPIILGKLAGKTREAGDTDEIDQGSLISTLGLHPSELLGGLTKGMFGGGEGKKGGGSLGDLFK
ncbi:DUF937 domain-containing protein [Lewinella sp. IMCC34183]|uniref:DUF937 domain-containing protein n=1 Tax=Lewinella sp. IMCC34183 TaxID=2248762 RepID=UPI000E2555BE|nr:DUF937 domain-containing protein [Lewinella sp. IMCC34183]